MPAELPIPDDVRGEIYRRVYRKAAEMRWQHASADDKSRQYAAWAVEPDVGGVLERYMDPERVRSWLKDVPMKEFSRALAGIGPHARFVDRHGPTPSAVAKAAYGAEAVIVEESVGIKPLHCRARHAGGTVFLTWGPSKDFKHLLWAALKELEQPSSHISSAAIVIVTSAAEVVPDAQQRLFEAIAGRCDLSVHYLTGVEGAVEAAS